MPRRRRRDEPVGDSCLALAASTGWHPPPPNDCRCSGCRKLQDKVASLLVPATWKRFLDTYRVMVHANGIVVPAKFVAPKGLTQKSVSSPTMMRWEMFCGTAAETWDNSANAAVSTETWQERLADLPYGDEMPTFTECMLFANIARSYQTETYEQYGFLVPRQLLAVLACLVNSCAAALPWTLGTIRTPVEGFASGAWHYQLRHSCGMAEYFTCQRWRTVSPKGPRAIHTTPRARNLGLYVQRMPEPFTPNYAFYGSAALAVAPPVPVDANGLTIGRHDVSTDEDDDGVIRIQWVACGGSEGDCGNNECWRCNEARYDAYDNDLAAERASRLEAEEDTGRQNFYVSTSTAYPPATRWLPGIMASSPPKPLVTLGPKDNPRLTGVELEFNGAPAGETAITAWAKAWRAKVVGDGSCAIRGKSGMTGREAITAPMPAKVQAECLKAFYEAFRADGAKANHQCGLHVHVDARDLGWWDIRRLMMLWAKIEPVMYVIGGQHRAANQYCLQSVATINAALAQEDWKGAIIGIVADPNSMTRYVPGGDNRAVSDSWRKLVKEEALCKKSNGRYRAINLAPWVVGRRNNANDCTVEFRLHRNSTDPARIANWTSLLADLVTWVARSTDADVERLPRSALRSLLSVAPQHAKFIMGRIRSWRKATTASKEEVYGEAEHPQPKRNISLQNGVWSCAV